MLQNDGGGAMEEQFIAHISDSGKVQSVAEHSPKTATLIKCAIAYAC